MSEKTQTQRVNIPLFCCFLGGMMGEKRKKTRVVGSSLIWIYRTILHSRFWIQRNHLRYCWLWKIIKISQHQLENRGCRDKVSFSAPVENGMVALCLGIQLFSCENLSYSTLRWHQLEKGPREYSYFYGSQTLTAKD